MFTAPLVLVPLAGGPRPLLLALLFSARFGSGFGVMVLDICVGSIFAAMIPNRLRARVTGAYLAVNYGVRPLGSVFGGVLAGVIGLRSTLWIVTVGAVIGALWLLPPPVSRLSALPDPAE
jgi:MFS family permease